MQRATKITKWILGILAALAITIAIVIAFLMAIEHFAGQQNYSLTTRIFRLVLMLGACTSFVVLSSLFVSPPKKNGMLCAVAIIVILRILSLYFCITQPMLYGDVDYYAIIVSLIGIAFGVFISYSMLKNKGWDLPNKKDEESPVSY